MKLNLLAPECSFNLDIQCSICIPLYIGGRQGLPLGAASPGCRDPSVVYRNSSLPSYLSNWQIKSSREGANLVRCAIPQSSDSEVRSPVTVSTDDSEFSSQSSNLMGRSNWHWPQLAWPVTILWPKQGAVQSCFALGQSTLA